MLPCDLGVWFPIWQITQRWWYLLLSLTAVFHGDNHAMYVQYTVSILWCFTYVFFTIWVCLKIGYSQFQWILIMFPMKEQDIPHFQTHPYISTSKSLYCFFPALSCFTNVFYHVSPMLYACYRCVLPFTLPICSMYGSFTMFYIYLPTFEWFLGQMLVNIPAPWSIWASLVTSSMIFFVHRGAAFASSMTPLMAESMHSTTC